MLKERDVVVCPAFSHDIGEIIHVFNDGTEIVLVDFHGFNGTMGMPCYSGHLIKIGKL